MRAAMPVRQMQISTRGKALLVWLPELAMLRRLTMPLASMCRRSLSGGTSVRSGQLPPPAVFVDLTIARSKKIQRRIAEARLREIGSLSNRLSQWKREAKYRAA
jgi:hypothetical protein